VEYHPAPAGKKRSQQEVAHLRTEVKPNTTLHLMIGNSDAMQKVFGMIEKAAQPIFTVSIYGETGPQGNDRQRRSIIIPTAEKSLCGGQCGCHTRDLIESELFGHEKGAFHGAVTRRIGKFEEADGVPFFLDEIGELDINSRPSCCGYCRKKKFTRVAATRPCRSMPALSWPRTKTCWMKCKRKPFVKIFIIAYTAFPYIFPPWRAQRRCAFAGQTLCKRISAGK